MAPSPTGEYHIGHIRTVLYNWAFAKKHEGKFIIRIEDTDRVRYIEGAMDKILDIIIDYGFTWDEGPRVGGAYGPYMQSERLEIYKKYALELVAKKAAYYCFCTVERLEKMRDEQRAKGITATKYDKHCLMLTPEAVEKKLQENIPYVIRLNVIPDKTISFHDEVFGDVQVSSNDIDDQVLLKSDGFPTYHLGVVVDDHLMEITHVMRGNDWIPSTPKHVILYNAFGWELPVYIHLPNLKEKGETKKLSKRFGPVAAREFLDEGYLPEATVNFLMLLGWNPGTDKEIYTTEEFVRDFDVKKIHKTDLVSFDRQKLTWMNGYYIQHVQIKQLMKKLEVFYKDDKEVLTILQSQNGEALVLLAQTRMKTLKEFRELVVSIPIAFTDSDTLIVKDIKQTFEKLSAWKSEDILEALRGILKKHGIKMNTVYRLLTGRDVGLPLPEYLESIPKEEILKRLT